MTKKEIKMGKKLWFIAAIISILALITLVDYNSHNVGVCSLQAYDPAVGTIYGPGMINSFEGGSFVIPPIPQYPPVGPRGDSFEWKGYAPFAIPTPKMMAVGGSAVFDGGVPSNIHGISFMRVTWTGKDLTSGQYMMLPATKFENVGCDSSNTMNARDMSCYEFITLRYYLNTQANGGSVPGGVSQTVSLTDGSMTITSWAVDVPGQANIAGLGPDTMFDRHITFSLRYFANQYNPATGRYFSISNVAGYSINAVQTDYTLWGNQPLPAEGYPVGSTCVLMYYDYLSAGAKLAPYPAPITRVAEVLYNVAIPYGINVSWHPLTYSAEPGRPVSAFHIYRATSDLGPWFHTGFAGRTITAYDDTSLPGGDAYYWYKVLTCDNGPAANNADEKLNTINASYHEDFLANATPFGVYVPPIPTPTITPTNPGAGPIVSPTITPTETASPVPTVDQQQGLTQAHVFPNPFNRNDGTKKVKVQNVPVKTKVQIFSMDGALVIDGEVKTSAGFVWDGKNKNGSKVVSGLYYLVMKDPKNKTRVERVIVCYKCKTVDNGE